MGESKAPRARDAEQTRRNILDAAIAEFAAKGLSGARVDEIAARTHTTKRMIYYYFSSKEQLFAAALEEMYAGIRSAEHALQLEGLPAEAAMRRLVETTFDYHADHPEFVRLVSVENIHEAAHIGQSATLRGRNDAVVGLMRGLLSRGEAEGVFRAGVDPLDLHILINGLCFHRVANRHTLGAIFGVDLSAPERRAAQRAMVAEAVLRYLRREG
ncbi:TetR/AcrR family transcriptional regulator [Pseudoroseomonas cervicalis]|uniref:TetR/AcrR family transcriptional regulator n=1 Tax=Teichococcus cervicalis TaxID=204525 RepID=UPI00278A5B60|nr:TetR/AcrR family transcriptional regulator [Pseudoroseomonas cervicalis]MDQ1080207.1 AcrR family transcriptional regulator [Pseudoroseomonas cervicalis]